MLEPGLDTEYENGVADVLAFLAGPDATVERNVRLAGLRGKRKRQVDVLVTTSVVPLGTTRVVVDCKRWSRRVDIPDVQMFYGFLEDVAADGGVLMASSGYTSGAKEFAQQARGLRLEVLTLGELAAWQPPGTVQFDYEIPRDREKSATLKLRRAGFRVATVDYRDVGEDRATVKVFQHFGTTTPSGEVQAQARNRVLDALHAAGVDDPRGRGNGLVFMGGTPMHRWLSVTHRGEPLVQVLAATEEEAERQLDQVANSLLAGHPGGRAQLSYIKPDGWPVTGLFTGWGRT